MTRLDDSAMWIELSPRYSRLASLANAESLVPLPYKTSRVSQCFARKIQYERYNLMHCKKNLDVFKP